MTSPLGESEPKAVSICTASPSSIRGVNKSILLNLIRVHQPIARVQLSKLTGIFRSNISEIVDELIEEKLVREERAKPSGRGRVPYHLFLNDDGFLVLGVSVRPLQTTVALVGLAGRVRKQILFDTLATPVKWLQKLEKAAREIRARLAPPGTPPIRECGISFPGLIRAGTGEVVWAPFLTGFTGFPLAEETTRLIGIPTVVENDCNLATLAEMRLSEEEVAGLNSFVFVEIGEVGVGAGVILNGELYRGHDSTFAAEFGHMVVDSAGPKCTCGRRGCWELFVSDRATWRSYNPKAPFTASRYEHLIQSALKGDSSAVRAFRKTAKYLALGISNIAFGLNPELVILAGQITRLWPLISSTIENEYSSSTIKIRVRPARLPAEHLFLHGATHLALSKVFAKPRLGW